MLGWQICNIIQILKVIIITIFRLQKTIRITQFSKFGGQIYIESSYAFQRTFDTRSALSRSPKAAASCTIGCRGFLTSKLKLSKKIKMNLEKNAGMYFSSYFYFYQDDDFEKSKEAYLTITYPVEDDCSNGEMGSSLSYFCDAKLIVCYNLKTCIF